MRKLYYSGLLLLLIAANTFGQTGRIFNLSKLLKQDTLLSGWKIHAGDNLAWARPDFDDSKWPAGDPVKDVMELPQLQQTGKCWIRLHIRADSALTQQQLAAWVFQYTASEIYLNGKLIVKYGKVGNIPSATKAYSTNGDLFSLPLRPGIDNVIAVRLAYESGIIYCSPNFTPLSAFALYINSSQNATVNQTAARHGAQVFRLFITAFAGIFVILGMVYLIYFIFDPKQKVNLYYFLFSIFICYLCINLMFFFDVELHAVSTQMWFAFNAALAFLLSSFFLVLTIYTLFTYRSRLVFKILVAISGAFLIYSAFDDVLGFILVSNGFMLLCMLEGIRVSIWAIGEKKKDAGIVLGGLILSVFFIVWSGVLDQTTILALVTGLLAIFGFPLGMSIYLGIQNAATNQNLRISLIEVQTLSEQNLLKEQEKQQILADQNILLEKQVNERTSELNQSLNHLKATQTQLIQSEKMASLGELTAGIAHEIQNPLNFVNNFSEVSVELLTELKEEAEAGNKDDVLAIADDLTQNLQKINHHGKRADAIVKGMLEHSRIGTGEKQLTDLNQLADEFFKLSYHGLRAKDKTFNAELITNFDESLPKVNAIPQDIGRVMLNLFNNAFYAVNQKAKTAGPDYKPTVTINTFASPSGGWGASVRDNGIGMPDHIKNKIMQPFFTTKPTGEGTGLGLSLTYDMVVKGHGGSIQVNSIEGEGSEFIVALPDV